MSKYTNPYDTSRPHPHTIGAWGEDNGIFLSQDQSKFIDASGNEVDIMKAFSEAETEWHWYRDIQERAERGDED